jgi:predicted metal-dependent HD superfamily phosphohydrolase
MPMPRRDPKAVPIPRQARASAEDIPGLDALRSHVERRLRTELPPTLRYHGPHHTLDDVVPAVERLCRGEGVVGEDRRLVLAAALFHDMGFVESYHGNEPIGARIAAQTLPDFGFDRPQIERVADIIMATEMREVEGIFRQVPKDDPLKRILCDADLDNLGREDFLSVSDSLRQELSEQGKDYTEVGWLTHQVLFLSQQEWFTATQRSDRQKGKDRNFETMRRQLSDLLKAEGS